MREKRFREIYEKAEKLSEHPAAQQTAKVAKMSAALGVLCEQSGSLPEHVEKNLAFTERAFGDARVQAILPDAKHGRKMKGRSKGQCSELALAIDAVFKELGPNARAKEILARLKIVNLDPRSRKILWTDSHGKKQTLTEARFNSLVSERRPK